MKRGDIITYLAIFLFLVFTTYFSTTGRVTLLLDSVSEGCTDNDGDGYNSSSDCGIIDFNDNDKFLFPNAPEWCDGKDNDNNGRIDYISSQGDLCSNKDCYSEICKFGMIWHSIGSSDYNTINKFDLILSNGQNADKGTNINAKFITHRTFIEASSYSDSYHGWSTINSNEDWFFHSGSGGRLQNSEYPFLWLINISNNYYKNFKVQETATISTYPGLDGWFYDNFISYQNYNNMLGRNYGISASSLFSSSSQYEDIMKNSAYLIKKSLGNKLLIANDHAYTGYSQYFDGYMAENWVHNSANNGWEPYYTESFWLQDIQKAQNSAHSDKMLILVCKNQIWDQSIFDFCFASYLLAKTQNSKIFFGFDYSGNNELIYYPEYDINLGAPINNYYIQNDLYQRDFENGKVILNVKSPAQTRSLQLSDTYKDFYGNPVSTLTLEDHEATILLKAIDSNEQDQEGNEQGVQEEDISTNIEEISNNNEQANTTMGLETNHENESIINLINTNYKEFNLKQGEYKLKISEGINRSLNVNEILENNLVISIDGDLNDIDLGSSKILNLDGSSITITYLEYLNSEARIGFEKEELAILPNFENYYKFFYILVAIIILTVIIISLVKYNRDKEMYG